MEITGNVCIFAVSALTPKAGALVDAAALTDCELFAVDQESAQQLMLEHPSLAINVLESALSLLSNRVMRIEDLSSYNLSSRSARWSLEQFRAQGVKPDVGATIEIESSQ